MSVSLMVGAIVTLRVREAEREREVQEYGSGEDGVHIQTRSL